MRFVSIGSIPFGLYQDEAFNGLDALRVLSGTRPLYFTTNNGREPLYIYLASLSIACLGRTPTAVRLPAALIGALTIPITAFLGKTLFNRRVGILAAALISFTFWPIHLSRIAFRAVGFPMMIGLAMAAGWHGARYGKKKWLFAGGLFYGLAFYTYLPVYFTLPVLALLCVYLWRRGYTNHLKLALWFVLGTILAFLPLCLFELFNPGTLFGRTGQVSILNQDRAIQVVLEQVLRALGMFFWQGDTIPRHNLPGRPVFDMLTALFLIPGLIWILRNWRKPAAFMTLTWSMVMLAPTILAEDTPHFLRAVGVLPMAFFIPALGMDRVGRWIESKKTPAWLSSAVLASVLFCGLAITVNDYFRLYINDPNTGYAFQSAAVELADQMNAAQETVWASDRFAREWESIPFLVDVEKVNWLQYGATDHVEAPASLFLWPYESGVLLPDNLPASIAISGRKGPLIKGDLETNPYPLYWTYSLEKKQTEFPFPLAKFAGNIKLEGGTIKSIPVMEIQAPVVDELIVTLFWRTDEKIDVDYTVFVHVMGPDGITAQDDSEPAGGTLPTRWWAPGNQIIDSHTITMTEKYDPQINQIRVGLYWNENQERLPVLNENDEPVRDYVILP